MDQFARKFILLNLDSDLASESADEAKEDSRFIVVGSFGSMTRDWRHRAVDRSDEAVRIRRQEFVIQSMSSGTGWSL